MPGAETVGRPPGRLRLLRRRDLLSLTALTWVFFFLYGPVEVALPVYVAQDLQASAQLLAAYWTAFGIGALASNLLTGALRAGNMRRIALLIVAGWGACLLPFAAAPVPVTLFFGIGGVYGPFVPLTYALFQSATATENLPAVLAARSAVIMVSTPLGTALGGPLVGCWEAPGLSSPPASPPCSLPPQDRSSGASEIGSGGRTRTYDQAVNSRPLYH